MKKCRMTVNFTLGAASLALLSLLNAGVLRAQEIRVVAEPNQAVRMGRGGYVCDGKISHTPIDNTEDWTYEMVTCSGPIYNSFDYAALNAKRTRDELENLNGKLAQLDASSRATTDYLNAQGQTLNGDLRGAIEKHFQDLPHDVQLTAAIQNLKKSLLDYVDERLPPNRRPLGPGRRQPNAAPNNP